jgi:hypothetical protein
MVAWMAVLTVYRSVDQKSPQMDVKTADRMADWSAELMDLL